MACDHGQLAVRISRPLVVRTVPVQLDPIAVRVSQVQGFADAVVGGSIEWYACVDQPA